MCGTWLTSSRQVRNPTHPPWTTMLHFAVEVCSTSCKSVKQGHLLLWNVVTDARLRVLREEARVSAEEYANSFQVIIALGSKYLGSKRCCLRRALTSKLAIDDQHLSCAAVKNSLHLPLMVFRPPIHVHCMTHVATGKFVRSPHVNEQDARMVITVKHCCKIFSQNILQATAKSFQRPSILSNGWQHVRDIEFPWQRGCALRMANVSFSRNRGNLLLIYHI
mmetsp:Transcript_26742/g.48354  ORF Transcript_26742/g.48354 Transcript_26742/m.48354 type:complete len:221 (+) Transcript_26742:175-837(+)